MTETEIDLARGYLSSAKQDPVAALVRSVRDVARLRRVLAAAPGFIEQGSAEAVLFRLSLRAAPAGSAR